MPGYDDLLVNTLKAYRRSGSKDYLGQPVEAVQTGTPNYTGACRVSTKSGGRANSDRAEDSFQNLWTVFLKTGADVREDDLVEVVTAAGGVVLLAGIVQRRYDVFGSAGIVHHVELQVTDQTGPLAAPGLATDPNAGAL